jgi:hypothetical protein
MKVDVALCRLLAGELVSVMRMALPWGFDGPMGSPEKFTSFTELCSPSTAMSKR